MRLLNILFAQAKAEPNTKAPDRAFDAAVKYLSQFRDHPAERRKLIATYIQVARQRGEVGLVNSAREHLAMLFNDPKVTGARDVELLEMAADLEILAGNPNKAVEYYREAIDTGSAPMALYGRLIDVYWQYSDIPDGKRKADALARDLIQDNKFKNDVAAQVIATRHRIRRGDEKSARDLLSRLMGLPGGATDPEALLTAAQLELTGITPQTRDARLKAAQEWCEKAVRPIPKTCKPPCFSPKRFTCKPGFRKPSSCSRARPAPSRESTTTSCSSSIG